MAAAVEPYAGRGRYDYLAGGDCDRFLFFPIVGYNEDNHDIIRTMLTSPETMLGLSDGGAHCSSISDAIAADAGC